VAVPAARLTDTPVITRPKSNPGTGAGKRPSSRCSDRSRPTAGPTASCAAADQPSDPSGGCSQPPTTCSSSTGTGSRPPETPAGAPPGAVRHSLPRRRRNQCGGRHSTGSFTAFRDTLRALSASRVAVRAVAEQAIWCLCGARLPTSGVPRPLLVPASTCPACVETPAGCQSSSAASAGVGLQRLLPFVHCASRDSGAVASQNCCK
jgi:hypothetical protein